MILKKAKMSKQKSEIAEGFTNLIPGWISRKFLRELFPGNSYIYSQPWSLASQGNYKQTQLDKILKKWRFY